MENLPPHIIVEILARLPAKSLIRFKSVCKLWLSSISTPKFAKEHLNQAIKDDEATHQRIAVNHPILCSLDPENLSEPNRPIHHFQFAGSGNMMIVGSCHGLVCLYLSGTDGAFLLLNPTTRESRVLPPPPGYDDRYTERFDYCGFGYDSGSDDYKVTRLVCSFRDKTGDETGFGDCTAQVFSVRENSWRTRHSSRYYQPCDPTEGIFLNGALHWSAWSCGTEPEDVQFVLLAFDLREEKLFEIPKPGSEHPDDGSVFSILGVMKGRLACTRISSNGAGVWIMKEYNVKEYSWTKVFDLYPDEEIPVYPAADLLPACPEKDGVIERHNSGKQFLLLFINPEAMSVELCPIAESESSNKYGQVVAYLETLVSPFGATSTQETIKNDGVGELDCQFYAGVALWTCSQVHIFHLVC